MVINPYDLFTVFYPTYIITSLSARLESFGQLYNDFLYTLLTTLAFYCFVHTQQSNTFIKSNSLPIL